MSCMLPMPRHTQPMEVKVNRRKSVRGRISNETTFLTGRKFQHPEVMFRSRVGATYICNYIHVQKSSLEVFTPWWNPFAVQMPAKRQLLIGGCTCVSVPQPNG